MKDLLLIDSSLSVNFRANVIDIANYLCNQLSRKCCIPALILEATWTNIRQILEYICKFGSRVNTFISSKKCTKADI